MSSSAGVVWFREGLRQSRRWQTWALRVVVTGLLMAVVLAAMVEAIEDVEVWDFGGVGKRLFELYVGVQLAFVCIVAPLKVALGVLEEREERTLDLLVLSGLTPAQILWGKVGSQLAGLLLAVLGGLPVLALVMNFGGVGVWQVVGATLGTLAAAVILGAIGGFFALVSRGPVPAVLGALLWLQPALVVVPFPYASLSGGPGFLSHLSPLFAVARAEDARVLLGIVAILPALALTMRLGLPVFRIATADAGGEGLLTVEYWQLERLRRRVWLATAATVAAWLAFLLVLVAFDSLGLRVPDAPATVAMWCLSVATLTVGTGLYLLFGMWLLQASRAWLDAQQRFAALRREVGLASARVVWSFSPVAWRELATRAHAGPAWSVAGVTVAFAAFAMLVFATADPRDQEIGAVLSSLGYTGVLLGGVVLATASMADERSRRTLGLLLTTRVQPLDIVAGKLLAVVLRLAPLLVLASVVYAAYPLEPSGLDGLDEHLLGPQLASGRRWIRAGANFAWVGVSGLAVALGCMLAALKVRPPLLAWPASIALLFVYFLTPLVTAAIMDGLGMETEVLRIPATLWLPVIDSLQCECVPGGTPRILLVSLGVHGVVALLGLVLVLRELRQQARRGLL